MSSGLQLDVRYHIQWRRHLVNAYGVEADMVFFACLSALSWFVPCKALYKCSDFDFFTSILLYRLSFGQFMASYYESELYSS